MTPGLSTPQKKLTGLEDGWGWFLGSSGEVRVDVDCPELIGLGLPGFTAEEWEGFEPRRRGMLARNWAGMKLFEGGDKVVEFACRAGDGGAGNPRKQVRTGAPLRGLPNGH